MGFLMGCSCLVPTLLSQSLPMSSYSSSSHSLFLSSHIRNVRTRSNKNGALPIICNRHESPNDVDFVKRRAILVLGISSLSFLQLRAKAVDILVKEERDLRIPKEKRNAEEPSQTKAPSNPFLSFLNVIGIIGSSVLGALYTLTQKENTAKETTIESLKNKLGETEASMISMEKKFEKRLRDEQEERSRQIKKAKEGQLSLSNQLDSANSTISGLGQQLLNEKRLVEELQSQIARLENDLTNIRKDNKALEAALHAKLETIAVLEDRVNLLTLELKDKEVNLENLKSSLVEKESECDELKFVYKRSKEDLRKAKSEIESLKEAALQTIEELNLKNSTVDDLNTTVTLLTKEINTIKQKLHSLQVDYNDLKSSSEKKAASDAKLLEEKEFELEKLEEKFKNALKEVSSNKGLISDLTQERDDLRRSLEVEANNVENLKHEVQVTQEKLKASRTEASNLSKQLEESRKSYQDLTSEMSRIQAVFGEARESLKKQLKEARSSSEVLSGELAFVKKVLEKTKEELLVASNKLTEATETREGLEKELVDVYKKVEQAVTELKQERKVTASLTNELEASRVQIVKDKEARQGLETDLEEATKSLDVVNKNVLMLSRELDISHDRIADLESDKELLYKSLVKHKKGTKEAQENVEDADKLIMKLGKEREILNARGKKLEEDLASAKGEILRLRTQVKPPKSRVNDEPEKKNGEVEGHATIPVKKTRRRKSSNSSSDSEL